MKKLLIIIVSAVILIYAGAWVYSKFFIRQYSLNEMNPTIGPTQPILYKDLVQIDSPLSGASITSPVKVSGKARGNWYFEASFPVEVLDEDGTSLGIAPVQAQGEWMTTEYVPFSGEITFEAPKGKTGKVVFRKDNPSGLSENEDSVSIPIEF